MKTLLSNNSLLKQPSAYIPLIMSLAALALVVSHVAIYGVVRQTDEGAAARIFQLLLAAQLPIVAWFAIRWGLKRPKETLVVLVLQGLAGLIALAPVFILEM
jgi:hypothetical protein